MIKRHFSNGKFELLSIFPVEFWLLAIFEISKSLVALSKVSGLNIVTSTPPLVVKLTFCNLQSATCAEKLTVPRLCKHQRVRTLSSFSSRVDSKCSNQNTADKSNKRCCGRGFAAEYMDMRPWMWGWDIWQKRGTCNQNKVRSNSKKESRMLLFRQSDVLNVEMYNFQHVLL